MPIERPEGWVPRDVDEAQAYINEYVRIGGGDRSTLALCRQILQTKDSVLTGSQPAGSKRSSGTFAPPLPIERTTTRLRRRSTR